MKILNFTIEIDKNWSDEHNQIVWTGLVKVGNNVVLTHPVGYAYNENEAEEDTQRAFAKTLEAALKPWAVLHS